MFLLSEYFNVSLVPYGIMSSLFVRESCEGKLRENGEELEQWKTYKYLKLEETM